MALYTKKLIMSTFQEMLEELPFDKITVAALVKRAGISPNTFYYHYQDIYALLDVWFRERAESFIPSNAPILTFTPLHSSAQETARTESFCEQT